MSTVLYWLADTSEGSVDTWDFLDRRIKDVLQLPRLQSRLTKRFEKAARYFTKRLRRRAQRPTRGPATP